jgi:RNA polymerase sigma factor (sigma-70 family)
MSHTAIRDYLRAAIGENPVGPSDAELLARFAASRDEASFELLVWRHASLIQRVCRGIVRDHHAAEDAAQAAFLILARKAHTFAGRGSVIGWLFRIARRVAFRLSKERARSTVVSSRLVHLPATPQEPSPDADEIETICAEVVRLPERYRVPVLLCFFEGLTHAEAARRTGWAIGTVAGRLARAKRLLAQRLSRKGIGLAGAAFALPAGNFVGATANAGVSFSRTGAVVPGIKPTVTSLAEGVLKAMTATKLKFAALAVFGLVAMATGWTLSIAASPQPQDTTANAVAQAPVAAQAPKTVQPPAAQPVKPKQENPAERKAHRADQELCSNSLKQIMLAIHNYAAANNVLPHDITDKDGKPLLSWRVEILPYIEQQGLYMEFKRDEPWDGEHNKKLMAKMPNIYRLGFQKKDDKKSYFQGFAGAKTAFEPGKKLNFVDFTDGTSNTLGVVVLGPSVDWSKPADIAYDPNKPLPKLDVPYNNLFTAGFMDGSVHSFKPELDPKVLKMLIERDDGQPVPDLTKLDAPKLPLTKEDITMARGIIKEDTRLLTGITEQLKELQKNLDEVAAKPNLSELEMEGFRESQLLNPSVLAELLEELKKKNEELRKLVREKEKK